MWAVFFFHGMTPGFWLPALTNILRARGLGDWVAAVFVVDLPDLGGADRIRAMGVPVRTLVAFAGH